MEQNADPAAVYFPHDNIRLCTAMHAEGFPWTAHRHPSAGNNGQTFCYFRFAATPEVLAFADAFFRGDVKLDPSRYEQAKIEVYARVNAVSGRRSR